VREGLRRLFRYRPAIVVWTGCRTEFGDTAGSEACATRGGFPGDDRALANAAPAIIADNSGFANDAVAGNEHGEWVASDSGADGAGSSGSGNDRGQVFITDQGAGRYLEKGAPHSNLKRGSANPGAQRALCGGRRRISKDQSTEARGRGVIPKEAGLRPKFAELGDGFGGFAWLDEGEVTNTAAAFCRQPVAEGRFSKTKTNLRTCPAGFDFAGGGGFEVNAQIVEPAWPGQTSAEGGVENTLSLAEQFPGVIQGEILEKILGSDARPRRKEPVKMGGAESDMAGEHGEVGLIGVMLIKIGNDPSNTFVIVHR
jgi:hypothetical protein